MVFHFAKTFILNTHNVHKVHCKSTFFFNIFAFHFRITNKDHTLIHHIKVINRNRFALHIRNECWFICLFCWTRFGSCSQLQNCNKCTYTSIRVSRQNEIIKNNFIVSFDAVKDGTNEQHAKHDRETEDLKHPKKKKSKKHHKSIEEDRKKRKH